ncbi:hypothetical protein Q5689_14725 [Microcoleus sp. ARI1-A2]
MLSPVRSDSRSAILTCSGYATAQFLVALTYSGIAVAADKPGTTKVVSHQSYLFFIQV